MSDLGDFALDSFSTRHELALFIMQQNGTVTKCTDF